MAHYRRPRPRTTSSRGGNRYKYAPLPYYSWVGNWPRWHDIVFHNRPRRRRTKACEIKIVKGFDPDAMNWPLEKKPHIYYW